MRSLGRLSFLARKAYSLTITKYCGGILILSPNVHNLSLSGQALGIAVVVPFLNMTRQFTNNVTQISQHINSIVMALAGAERVFEIMDAKPGIKDNDKPGIMPKIEGEVEFKNVTFAYEKDHNVLHNVSFTVVNPYPLNAKPYIKITGSGDVSFAIQSGGTNRIWNIKDIY